MIAKIPGIINKRPGAAKIPAKLQFQTFIAPKKAPIVMGNVNLNPADKPMITNAKILPR